jgi:transcriptional regulator of heat shock response
MRTFKLTENDCIEQIKNYHAKFIVNKTIRELKKIKDMQLSGDDSGLKNFWEEYAVQLQEEQSFFFDTYVETIRNFVDAEISKQPEEIQKLLDFSENEDFDEDDEFENCKFYYNRDKAVDSILNDIDSIAINFENKNITKYLERDY